MIFSKEDLCIIGVPSFGGRVPAIALERIKALSGNNATAILITVYGNRAYEDTLIELEDTLIEKNFTCQAAIAAVAEHSTCISLQLEDLIRMILQNSLPLHRR